MTEPTVSVRIVAFLDDGSAYEFGNVTLTRGWHGVELAALFREIADEVERQGPQDPHVPSGGPTC